MPGNTVIINNADELEWYVGDSKMEELIKWLNENGSKMESEDAPPAGEPAFPECLSLLNNQQQKETER